MRLPSAKLAIALVLAAPQPAWATLCVAQVPGSRSDVTGTVYSISDPDPQTRARFVGTKNGLFILDSAGKFAPVPGVGKDVTGTVYSISDPDPQTRVRFVQTDNGLFFLDSAAKLAPVPRNGDYVTNVISRISDLDPQAQTRIVGAMNGLFILNRAGKFAPVSGGSKEVTSFVNYIADPDPQTQSRLVGAGNGLFILNRAGKLTPVPGGGRDVTSTVYSITDHDRQTRARFVVAENGLFILDSAGKLTPVPGASKDLTGKVYSITNPDRQTQARLIGARNGLFILSRSGKLAPVPGGGRNVTRGVKSIADPDPQTQARFVGAASGLFILDRAGKLAPVRGGGRDVMGTVYLITDPDLQTRAQFVITEFGLFRMLGPEGVGSALGVRDGSVIRYGLSGHCVPYLGNSSFQLRDESGREILTNKGYDLESQELTLTLADKAVNGRIFDAQLFVIDLEGTPHPIGEPLRVRQPMDLAEIVRRAVVAAGILHTMFFGGLMLLAGRSDRAAGMLMHPLAQTIGIWWAWIVQYSPTVQRRLLVRWFNRRKSALGEVQEVLPLPLSGTGGAEMASTGLAALLRPGCRVWLTGNPGMGKTALARQIEAEFFRHPDLGTAFNAYGFIPLFIQLRSAADPGKGDRSFAARLAEAALSGQGWLADENAPARNSILVDAFVRRSGFVLLLDGANEVPWFEEISNSAAASDQPGLLVTSQASPSLRAELFEEWKLPPTMAIAVEPLLKLYLGEAKGSAAYRRIGPTLLADLKSGYDVRLIDSLHREGAAPFPENRVGLYRAIIDRLFAHGDPLAEEKLGAFAWALWLSGGRQFPEVALDASVREALAADRQAVTRVVGGDRREFRHDQMRGYLAARHVVSAANMLGVLEESEPKWPTGKTEQDLVWQFLAELSDDLTTQRVYKWALLQPENRNRLQIAFTSPRTTAMVA